MFGEWILDYSNFPEQIENKRKFKLYNIYNSLNKNFSVAPLIPNDDHTTLIKL